MKSVIIAIPLVLHFDSVYGLSIRTKVHRVPKIDKAQFDQNVHYYHSHETNGNPYETPVLVMNALSKEGCGEISTKILQELGENIVDLQRKVRVLDEHDNEQTETEILDLELEQAFGYMMESQHDDAFFCFCEGLLDGNNNLESVRKTLQHAKESLFAKDLSQSANDQKSDLFEHFPENVKPSDCLVVAGEGATSTLHRDPFCWTGTSLCVEGTKIWRFIAPPGHLEEFKEGDITSGVKFVDDAVESYRLPSVAWDNYYISSGWQSDMSLYSQRSEDLPTAEEFAIMEEEDPQQKTKDLERIASSLDSLEPSSDFPTQLDDCGNLQTNIWTVVQHPGDLLIIPAYWWHQTYAVEPSIAIASQRGGDERDTKRVLSHIFETVGIEKFDDKVLKAVMDDSFTGSQKDIATALFQVLSSTFKLR
jgi:hypothetical protein